MELYIDDANTKEIRRLSDTYPVDGVTTNPSILARTGRNPVEVLKEIRMLLGPERLIFAQAIPTDAEGMIRDAHAICTLLGEQTIVKIPAIPEGFQGGSLDFASSLFSWIIFHCVHNLKWIGCGILVAGTTVMAIINRRRIIREAALAAAAANENK